LDSISYNIIKHIPISCLYVIIKLFNLIWNHGQLPKEWKHSIVIPILKPNKPKFDPNSYRPISLTSSLCKLMERIVTTRLASFVETNGLLTHCQAGFRKGRSCLDQIMCLQDEIIKSLGQRGMTLAVLLTLKKRLT